MKCPRCLAVCLDDDPSCPSCHTPFGADRTGPPAAGTRRPPSATRLGLLGLAAGAGLGPLVGPLTGTTLARVPTPPPAVDPNILLWGLAGAALGLALGLATGYGLGVALSRPEEAGPDGRP